MDVIKDDLSCLFIYLHYLCLGWYTLLVFVDELKANMLLRVEAVDVGWVKLRCGRVDKVG
eukprot:12203751-Ditylum_brightwellii.AAC.1